MKILYPKEIDLKKYSKDNNFPEAYYGLSKEVKFCKKCVISNQRPNSTIEFKNNPKEKKKTINFDENGICDACNYAERKKQIDWNERNKSLDALCNKNRKNKSSNKS